MHREHGDKDRSDGAASMPSALPIPLREKRCRVQHKAVRLNSCHPKATINWFKTLVEYISQARCQGAGAFDGSGATAHKAACRMR